MSLSYLLQKIMFKKEIIDTNENLFSAFSDSFNFECVGKGRKIAILVSNETKIPIVRTTTNYKKSGQIMNELCYDLINEINIGANANFSFNNAMAEIYDDKYMKMGFHSDQSLDLEEDSSICIFSCYKQKTVSKDVRKLVIKNKSTGKSFDILLEDKSIVTFSVQKNKEYVHKIILEHKSNNEWLGITFRLSKTFIEFVSDVPYFCGTDKILRIATENEKKEFCRHKGRENRQIGYKYPEIDYTISCSDLMKIKK